MKDRRSYSLGGLRDISSLPNKTHDDDDYRVSLVKSPLLPPPDMTRKRVRFAEPDAVHPPSCNDDTCSINAKVTLASKFEDPKTSEYTFYKKLRQDAGFQSHQLHKMDNQFEKFEATNKVGELTSIGKPNYEIRSLSPIDKITHQSLSPIEKVTRADVKSHLSSGVSRNPGPRSKLEGVFSVKRHNLLHLAAEASFLDIDEWDLKGYDLLPRLLRRLVSETSAFPSTSCTPPTSRSRHMGYRRESQLLGSSGQDIRIEELPQPTSMNLTSPFCVRDLENDSLEGSSNKSKVRSLSQWAHTGPDSLLTWHPEKSHLAKTECDTIFDDERTSNVHATRGSVLDIQLGEEFSFSRDGKHALDYIPGQSRMLSSTHLDSLLTWHPGKTNVAWDRTESNTIFHDEKTCMKDSVVDEEVSFNRDGYLALDYIPGQSGMFCSTHPDSLLAWHPDKTNLVRDRTQPDTIFDDVLGAQRDEVVPLTRDEYLTLGDIPGQYRMLCSTHVDSLLTWHSDKTNLDTIFDDEKVSFDQDEYLALEEYMPVESRMLGSTYENMSFYCDYAEKSFGVNSKSSFKEFGVDNVAFERALLGWDSNSVEKLADEVPNGERRWSLNCEFSLAELRATRCLLLEGKPKVREAEHLRPVTTYLSDFIRTSMFDPSLDSI